MSTRLPVRYTEKLEGSISANNRTAISNISNKTVNIDGIPQEVIHCSPDITVEHTSRVNPRRTHHESRPCIGLEHHHGANRIEQQAQSQMHPLLVATLEPVPAIVIDIQHCTFREEQQGIIEHTLFEYAR